MPAQRTDRRAARHRTVATASPIFRSMKCLRSWYGLREGVGWMGVGEHMPCLCCGRSRSWTELGTFTTDLSSEFDLADGTLMQTVLYCRDDSECRGTAQTLRLIHSGPLAPQG